MRDTSRIYSEYLNEAVQLVNSGKLRLAIVEYTQAIDLDPSLYKGYAGRGRCYGWLCNYELAVKDCQTALACEGAKKIDILCYLIGTNFAYLGNLDMAIMYLTKAIDLKRKVHHVPSGYSYARGVVFSRSRRYRESAKDLIKSIKSCPTTHRWQELASVHAKMGDEDLAIEATKRGKKLQTHLSLWRYTS